MNSKYLSIFCLSTVLLAGCATPDKMRQSAPYLELTSSNSSKSVAICIANKWENGSSFGTYPVSMRPTNTGYTISVTNYPTLFTDVNDLQAGSTIKFYRDGVSPGFEADVIKCAGPQ
jgi:hypothetical protein